MNLLFLGTIVFLVIMMIIGLKNGFVKMAYSILSIALSLILVSSIAPYVQEFLIEKTTVYEFVVELCSEKIGSQINAEEPAPVELYLPKAFCTFLEKIEQEKNEQVEGIVKKTATAVADWLIYAASFVFSFVIVLLMLRWIGKILDIVTKLPVLRGTNKLLGLAAGFIQGIIFLWVAALVLSIFCTTNIGQQILVMVNENQYLRFLYNYNGIIYLAVLFL